ncbi:UNKNOWN [Stylonychia lemnae]|uniref:Transmembrane protein n=1 Tax=Stylonychia lemnae TaxID=5949 RepID=A0A078AKQ5_STYLE|nr:UNKNOWN [Stylonychia lemnae]|eukprot:CDW82476.1 UNKNOWN [Stylonychia lemnae]
MQVNHLRVTLMLCSLALLLSQSFCTLDYLDDDNDLKVEEIYNSFIKQSPLNLSLVQFEEVLLSDRKLLKQIEDEASKLEAKQQKLYNKKLYSLEKQRQKANKYRIKWELFENQAQIYLNKTTQCNLTCTQNCLTNNKEQTVFSVFLTCLASECECINSFAIQNVPEPIYNKSQQNYGLGQLKNLSQQVEQGKPAVKSSEEDLIGYDIVRDCDEECDKECLDIKKYVPFDVVAQCSRQRCNCWYDYNTPIQTQIFEQKDKNQSEQISNVNVGSQELISEQQNATQILSESVEQNLNQDHAIPLIVVDKEAPVIESNQSEGIQNFNIEQSIAIVEDQVIQEQESVVQNELNNATIEINQTSDLTIPILDDSIATQQQSNVLDQQEQGSNDSIQQQEVPIEISQVADNIQVEVEEQVNSDIELTPSETITPVSVQTQQADESQIVVPDVQIENQQQPNDLQAPLAAVSFLALDDVMIKRNSELMQQKDRQLLNATLGVAALFMFAIILYQFSQRQQDKQRKKEKRQSQMSYKGINVDENNYFYFKGESDAPYQKLE